MFRVYGNAYISRRNFLIDNGNAREDDVLKFNGQNGDSSSPVYPY
ncbi:MAG: hypothetical protein ABSB19_11420 [Methylomonas sp.]|jgi:hypothetical protein